MNRIDPNLVPKRILASGEAIPCVGMGTFGSDHCTPEQISNAVLGAARLGYRLFDCAACYGNEEQIGHVFQQIMNEGIKREELFITSKLWNNMHKPADAEAAFKKTLHDLKLDYLDLYMIHWPFRNYHEPGCAGDARNPNSHAYIHEEYMETWAMMEKFQKEGLTRYIGTSNMSIAKMQLLLRDCTIRPAFNEMEIHPCFQQKELYNYCLSQGIQPIAYSPIGSPSRPARDKTESDIADIEHPVVVEIAKAHNVHPAVICIKWAAQHGQIPIPFSVKQHQYESNLRCVVEDPLTPEKMAKLEKADENCRLIKGQVFLWEGVEDYRILWDEDGVIRAK
jgi:alcohol dehydrogenase (NADP+)